ncbi:MAG: PspC domain-containing protein [Bacteroidales bacterium]|nr:PspC domain-containing protein [Bacteroidales bacterium]
MKQTENISLGGYSFTIGKDALELLQEYLSKVEASSSSDVKDELVSDIEERLAELFIEKCGKASVIDLEAVKSVTSIIGVPEPDESESHSEDSTSSSSSGDSAKTSSHRRIYRDMDNRLLGGVLSGIASYFSLDVTFLRLLTAVFMVVFFIGHFLQTVSFLVLAYVVMWVIMPAPKSVEEKCEFEGKPLRFDDFKDRAESLKDSISSSAERLSEEVKTAPIGHTLARALSVVVGTISTIIGIVALLVALCLVIDFPFDKIDYSRVFVHFPDDFVSLVQTCLTTSSIRWALTAVIGLLGLGQLYDGVKNIFNLKSPSWKPGLIIFILWCVSIIVLMLLVTKNVLILNNVILTV